MTGRLVISPYSFPIRPVVSLPFIKSHLTFTNDVSVQMEEQYAIAQVHDRDLKYNTLRLRNLAHVALLHTAICCAYLTLSTLDKVLTTKKLLSWFLEIRIWTFWYFQIIKHHFSPLKVVLFEKYLVLRSRIDPSYYALSRDKNKPLTLGFWI